MTRIRLMRMGARNAPFFRVVVADNTSPRDGRFIENVGYYNPTKHPQIVEIKADRVLHWLSNGAAPTETVRSLLRRQGILKQWHEIRQGKSAAGLAAEAGEASDTASAGA